MSLEKFFDVKKLDNVRIIMGTPYYYNRKNQTFLNRVPINK